jgi:nodulation protein E
MVPADVGALVDQRLGRPTADALDPVAWMVLAASAEALDQAGLRRDPVLEERTAIVFGHAMAGMDSLEKGFQRIYGQRSPRLHPLTIPRIMVSAPVSAAAMAFGVKGPVFAVSSACASSSHAIWQTAALIAGGQVDVALAGGSEAMSTPGCVRSWQAIRVLSSTGCRPFSADRDGMILGEGGAVMVLEEYEHAVARGAPILGELLGAGMSSDAAHITSPSPEGQARAIRQACVAADALERDDMLISAHGTGTVLNDAAETEAFYAVFGPRAGRLPVIATKSAHGHAVGGSGALQAVLGLRALAEGLAPPIQNFTGRDPACDLDLVVGAPRVIGSKLLLQNAFAFGGLNVALVFGGPPD